MKGHPGDQFRCSRLASAGTTAGRRRRSREKLKQGPEIVDTCLPVDLFSRLKLPV